MKPITPSGTRTREISMPLGRRHDSTTAPTGSGRAAISRSPCAISSIRDSVSVNRSRNALATRPRARSTSARLASSSTWLFSTSPSAICCSASFFVRVGHSAIARAAARAARARASIRAFGSILVPRFSPRAGEPALENHQIVPVNHFVEALVAQPMLDLLRLRPTDLPELGRVEVHDPPGEFLATRPAQERHHLPGVEVPFDLDYA